MDGRFNTPEFSDLLSAIEIYMDREYQVEEHLEPEEYGCVGLLYSTFDGDGYGGGTQEHDIQLYLNIALPKPVLMLYVDGHLVPDATEEYSVADLTMNLLDGWDFDCLYASACADARRWMRDYFI